MKRIMIREYDILRVLVTLLVIIGHSTYYCISTFYGGCDYTSHTVPGLSLFSRFAATLTDFIYLFHMPLYMALSGALYRLKRLRGGYRSYKSLIADKAKKLLVPFIVVTLLYSVPMKYVSGYYSNSNNIVKDVFVGQMLTQGNTHLWFLPALFLICIMIYPFEKTLNNFAGSMFLLLFSFSFSSVIIPVSIINNVLNYMFWFYVGYCFEDHRERVNESLDKHPSKICMFIAVFLLVMILTKVVSDMLADISIYSAIVRLIKYICAALGCYTVYLVSYLMSKTKILEWKWIKAIRENSLGLYLYSDTWNYVILSIAVSRFGNAVFVTNIGGALLYFGRITITFAIALAVSMALKKLKIKYIC